MAFYTFDGSVIPGSVAILWDGDIKKIVPWPSVITVDEDPDDHENDIVNIRSGNYVVRIAASDVEDATEAQDVIDELAVAAAVSKLGYKEYSCLISQSGGSAPVVTELGNTIGDIVWTRFAAGLYYATLAGAFPAEKVVFVTPATNYDGTIVITRSSSNIISITTGSDGVLSETPLVFRVYP